MSAQEPPPAGREQALYARGLRYSAYDTLSSLALGLASAILTARVFGADVVGAFALASLTTGALHLLSNVREQPALVRELTRYRPGAPEAPALTLVTLAFSVGVTLLVLAPFGALAVWLLDSVFDRPELLGPFAILTVSYLLVDNTSFNLDAPLVAYRDGRALWFARMAISATMIAGVLLCAIADVREIGGLVACTIAASIAGLAVRAQAVRALIGLRPNREKLAWARSRMRAIIGFGLRASPVNYSETAIAYTDTAVLGAQVSLGAVGAYSRAYGLYQRAAQVPVSLSRLYFPTISALFHRGDLAAMARVYRLSTRYLALVLVPGATWLAASSPAVMAVFGPGFDQAATALSILSFVVVLDCYSRPAGGVLWAANRPGIVSIVSVGVAVLNAGLCFALIPSYGLTGAAVANLGGWAVSTVALPLLASGHLERGIAFMYEPRFLLRLLGACGMFAAALLPLRDADAALVLQLVVAPPALLLSLAIARPLERRDTALVERALSAAGVRSERGLRLARRLHVLISRGSESAPEPDAPDLPLPAAGRR